MADFTLTLRIAADGRDAANGLRVVQSEISRVGQGASAAQAPVRGLGDGFGVLGASAIKAAGILGAGLGVAELTRAFLDATQNAQRLEASLTAVTGSSQAAAAEMDYIKATADRMGLSVNDVSEAYVNLSAAAKGTSLEGQATRDIFEAVALAMAKLGKSSADTQGALLGLEQLMGQTTANLEDLRQITDRIPSGMKLAADGMGMTVEQMKEMISKGEILVADIVPGLASQLRAFYDDGKGITGLQAEWNKFTNALADVAVGFDQVTGSTTLLGDALAVATDLARGLANALAAAANAKAGLGLTTFANDAEKLAAMEQRRLRAVQDYADAVRQVEEHSQSAFAPLTKWAADAEGKLQTLQKVSQEQFAFAKGLEQSAAASKKLGEAQALSMGDDAVRAWEEHNAVIKEHQGVIDKLKGSYDEQAKKAAQVRDAEAKLKAAVEAKAITQAQADVILKDYTASLDKSTESKGRAGGASKKLSDEQKLENKTLEEANRLLESLIDRYLPLIGASADLEATQQALAKTGGVVKTAWGEIVLTGEQVQTILQGQQQDFDKLQQRQIEAAEAARRESDGFYNAWAEGVEGLDGAFQGLWKGLLSGQEDVLDDFEDYLFDWLAKLSYQLLLAPLVVPIQTSMMGMMGGTMPGQTGITGAIPGQTGTSGTGLGGMINPFSWFGSTSTGTGWASGLSYVAGSTYGAMPNWFGTGMASLAQTPNWAFGVGGIGGSLLGNALFGDKGYGGIGATIGSTIGSVVGGASNAAIAAALGVAIPGIGAIIGGILGGVGGGFLGSLFGEDPPRYGTLAAQTLGRTTGLEDAEWGAASGAYVKGSMGLTFGITDKGSKGIDAPELRDTYEAMAQITDVLAQFFGEDLSAFIEEELANFSNFGDGLLHLTEEEGDVGGALASLIHIIASAAGKSSDEIGVAFGRLGHDLSGTAEEVANQLQTVMAATLVAVEASDQYYTNVGQMLDLTGTIGTDMDRLIGLSKLIQNDGEIAAEAVIRLVAQMGVLSEAAFTTGQDLTRVDPKALTLAADELVKLMGGLDKAVAAIAFYQQNFLAAGDLALRSWDNLFTELEQGWAALEKDWGGIGEVFDPGPMPQTRAEFIKMVESIDLTTESGRALYAELMKLAPGFDQVFDALEGFERWIDPAGEVERATLRVTAVFQALGLEIPLTYEALRELYLSGKLSAEQIGVLTSIMGDLDTVLVQSVARFRQLAQSIQDAVSGTRESIEEFGLTDDQLYDQYMGEAMRLMDSIDSLESPEEVAKVTAQINELLKKAWGLLSDEDKAAAQQQFLGYLDQLEQISLQRLADLQGTDVNMDGVIDAQDVAANAMSSAAQTMATASQSYAAATEQFTTDAAAFSASVDAFQAQVVVPLAAASASFDTSAGAFEDAVRKLEGAIGTVQAAPPYQYQAVAQSTPALASAPAIDTSLYQGVLSGLQAAVNDLKAAAAEYIKAGGSMDGAAKTITAAGDKFRAAAADIPSGLAITVTATNASATVEATF